MSKKAIGAIVAILVLIAAIYLGSPYWAVHSLKAAAIEGNTDKLEGSVDFPAVRESLKSQFSAALMTKMTTDSQMKSNPFAGLGMMLMPAMVDRMVDTFITADGMAAMIRGQKPGETKKVAEHPDIQSTTEYVGLDRFRVRINNAKNDQPGMGFLLERRGFASWKLVKVELPAGMLDDKKEIKS